MSYISYYFVGERCSPSFVKPKCLIPLESSFPSDLKVLQFQFQNIIIAKSQELCKMILIVIHRGERKEGWG